ncbi:MAG: hypothetical protein R3321_09995, partial [Nitrososphaeraceae archaeon]|nr:hypothetical protein [Nitrososphaeraceae archaeon]
SQDQEALQWNKNKMEYCISLEKSYQILFDRLINNVGGSVVCAMVDGELDSLISRGQVWMPLQKDIILMKGADCQCHRNSAALFEANEPKVKIVTGYGLSRDGIWRQHSWCIDEYNNVIETTIKRIAYYGFVLTNEEAWEVVSIELY